MAKSIIDIKAQIRQYKFANNLIQKIDCSNAENKDFINLIKSDQSLPEGIYRHKTDNGDELNQFYRIHETDLSESEVKELIMFKELECLKSIRASAIFFVVSTIVATIVAFIALNS